MNTTTVRGRLLASTMITGLALIAAPAFAADTTADTSPMATMNGAAAAPAAAPVQTLRATADAAADTTASTAEIVVTGSRIPQPNLTSVSPIQAVGHQEFQLEGHTDVIDLLNNLPQNFQNNTSDFSNTSNPLNGPGGEATADLRGLGPQRTLVLVNGRRLGIGDANTQNPNPAPDLDQIPAAMIDHVEVLTGGASSAYGSDAMAGVVNFILKKDFEGVQLDGTIGGDQHDQHNAYVQTAINQALHGGPNAIFGGGGFISPLAIPGDRFDGGNADASLIIGANAPDGKGNVTAYFEYHNQRPVRQANRDWAACSINDSSAPNTQFCSGSTNSNKFTSRNGPLVLSAGGKLVNERFTASGNGLVPWPAPGSQPPAIFNSNAYEFLSRGDVRYVGGYTAHYDISPQVQVYSEFNMMDDRTTEQIAPSGMFSGANPFDKFGDWQVNCNNPFLAAGPLVGGVTASQHALGCSAGDVAAGTLEEVNMGRRNIEGGPRTSYYEHFNFRGVAGVRGDLNDTWHYDAYGSYYYTFLFQDNSNYLSNSRIGKALDVVNVGGTPTCVSKINGTDTNCVPYDVFQTGGVTQAALNYLTLAGTETGTVQEQIVEGDLTGDLGKYGWKSPWASDGIGLALGADWRRDEISFTPDAIIGSGDLAGGSGVGTAINNAGISVWEGYGETRIPIAQDMPFIKLLQLDGGVRYSAYAGTANAAFNTLTWKVGLEWSPTDDVRFRGAYNKAIRAPSIIELFNPQSVGNIAGFEDPCLVLAPKLTLAQCERTGLPAGLYGSVANQCPAQQCDQLLGGNPNLKPEFADTFTVGATFTPHWVRGLSFSVDWWDIMNYGFVNAPGSPGNIFTDCAVNDNPASCALIHRAPATGLLFGPSNIQNGGYISQVNVNVGNGQVMGIDIQGDYHLDLEDVGVHGWGSLSWALNGSYLLKDATFAAGSSQDCAGLFGPLCQTVNPVWRHTIRMTWNSPWNALFSLQWRYISGTQLDLNVFQNAGDIADGHLPAMNYLDLASEWRVNTHLTVRAGVNNVLDTDPPIVSFAVSGSGTPNTYPTYDLLGRELFLSGTVRF